MGRISEPEQKEYEEWKWQLWTGWRDEAVLGQVSTCQALQDHGNQSEDLYLSKEPGEPLKVGARERHDLAYKKGPCSLQFGEWLGGGRSG